MYKIDEFENMSIGGVSLLQLAKDYGTPLYVMDESKIINNMNRFKNSFSDFALSTEVIYAGKAFLTVAMCKLVYEQGLSLDVVSGGELYTAKSSGFPMSKVYFHGNAKTRQELAMAIDYEVGTIVIDNKTEFEVLKTLIPKNQVVNVMLRLNTNVSAETHDYIKTAEQDSKFGVSVNANSTIEFIKEINSEANLNFIGIHTHIGSQILDVTPYYKVLKVVANFCAKLQVININCKKVNIGGGFGISYERTMKALAIEQIAPLVLDEFKKEFANHNLVLPCLQIEPGRSIVGEAGVTLYEVLSTKKTSESNHYIFVNGSMADHLRTALYDAKYEACVVGKKTTENNYKYKITGRACESGDIIIKEISLPEVVRGDIICVFATGAYHYSMASNYNRFKKPAVLFVNDGKVKEVVRRETYADIVRNDV